MSPSVVIAVDHSDLSARALPFARRVAELWHGRLVLVHALVAGDERLPVAPEVELREIVRKLGELGIAADAVIRRASPAQAIVDVVGERHADLIVMASHQRRGLDRWLHGSIAEEVLAKTTTPLLMIPAQGVPFGSHGMRVLLPLDGSSVGEAALEFLRGRSTTRPLELHLVRVVSFSPVVVGVDPAFTVEALTPAEFEAEVGEAHADLARVADTIGDASVTVRRRVIETADAIPIVILETARQERVDVIALGTHAKAGVSRLVLGSVSEEILERSPVPVLLVQQQQQAGAPAAGQPQVSEAPLAMPR